jgi:hypothetical protein
MKGYIKGKNIILLENIPENLKEGDEVDVSITPRSEENYPFPTFELGVKDEYLNREKIYELEKDTGGELGSPHSDLRENTGGEASSR